LRSHVQCVEANVRIEAGTATGLFWCGYLYGGTETFGIPGGSGTSSGPFQDNDAGSGNVLIRATPWAIPLKNSPANLVRQPSALTLIIHELRNKAASNCV
jgi:hypothetical protein